MISRTIFSSQSIDWATPQALYQALHAEFSFTLDPCPLRQPELDGLFRSWEGERVYCNPPYGPSIPQWLMRAVEPDVAVYLLPARTDTAWFHELCLPICSEIRFIRGRLRFGGATENAPFPSMLVIFRSKNC